MDNPWTALLDRADVDDEEYVQAQDRPYVEAFNAVVGTKPRYRLRTDLLPEPFTGPRDAPVVVLFLNPGVGGEEEQWHRRPDFASALRGAMSDEPSEHRHLGLSDQFADTGGGKWTRAAFKALREELGCRYDDLADKVLGVEFHGYHSRSWSPLPVTLPSQYYSFWLVDQAVRRGAVVVAMRGRANWSVAVPSLLNYPRLLPAPRSTQQKALSRKNLGDDAFTLLGDALR